MDTAMNLGETLLKDRVLATFDAAIARTPAGAPAELIERAARARQAAADNNDGSWWRARRHETVNEVAREIAMATA